jgi:hypothetical protein
MKAINTGKGTKWLAAIILFLYSTFYATLALAQEKDIDIDINAGKSDNWYAAPWVWIVGAAVFILLLVAILRGGSRRAE